MNVQDQHVQVEALQSELQKLSISKQPTEPQQLKKITGLVDKTFTVKSEYTNTIKLSLQDESTEKIRTFLNAPRLHNDVSLWELLSKVFQEVPEAFLVGDELPTFLDATINKGLTQLGVETNFIADNTPCQTLTFRFTTDRHAELASTYKQKFLTQFGILCSRVFSNPEETLSGITHVTHSGQKFHFIFAAPSLSPCFATCDAVQVAVSTTGYCLKNFCPLEQWLVDTALQILRPVALDASVKLCIRAMRKGMTPTSLVYEAFSKQASKETLLSIWLEANRESPGLELSNACIILHLAEHSGIDSSEFLAAIRTSVPNDNSFLAKAFQLVANTSMLYSMLEAALLTASLFQNSAVVSIDPAIRVVTIPNTPIRLPLNASHGAKTFADFPLDTVETRTFFESLVSKDQPTTTLQPVCIDATTTKVLQEALTSQRCVPAFILCAGLVHCQSMSPHFVIRHFLHVYNACPRELKQAVLSALRQAHPDFAFQESAHVVHDFTRALMRQSPPDIVQIFEIAKKETNVTFRYEVALFLQHADPQKALTLLGEMFDFLTKDKIVHVCKTFPLKEEFFFIFLFKLVLPYPSLAESYIPQFITEDATACFKAFSRLPDSVEKLQILREITKHCDTSKNPLQLVTQWARVFSQSPKTMLLDAYTPLLHACSMCTEFSESLGICLQKCAQRRDVHDEQDLRSFLPTVFCSQAVMHCSDFLVAMLQNLFKTNPTLQTSEKKHVRNILQNVIDEAHKKDLHHLVFLVLRLYQHFCNEPVLSESYKKALICAFESDCKNGSNSTQDDCRWYFSQMLAGKRPSAIEPYKQAVVFIRICSRFRSVLLPHQSNPTRYVQNLSARLSDEDRIALQSELDTLNGSKLDTELFAPFFQASEPIPLKPAPPTPAPKSELGQLAEKKQWLALGKKLLSTSREDPEAMQLAPRVVANLLKTTLKPLGIIFELVRKFHLTPFWMDALLQFKKENNSEDFSVTIGEFLISKNSIPVDEQKKIYRYFLTEGRALFTVRALSLLQDVSCLESIFAEDEPKKPLVQVFETCMDLLAKHEDHVKLYFTSLCSLLSKIPQEHCESKPTLSWKLFCLFRHDPSPENFVRLNDAIHMITLHILMIFEHMKVQETQVASTISTRKNTKPQQNENKGTTQNTLQPILDAFKPYLEASHNNRLPDEFFFLVGSIADNCQLPEVHLFLLNTLQNHENIDVVALLVSSIEFLKGSKATFSHEYFEIFDKIINRVITEGNESGLARIYGFFFVDQKNPPSTCKSPSLYAKSIKAKTADMAPPSSALRDTLVIKYLFLLQKAKNDALLANAVLDIAFSIIFCHRDFEARIRFQGHIELLIDLLLETVKEYGWTEKNINYYHFLLYLAVRPHFVKKDAQNCPEVEHYECYKKETIYDCVYKDPLVALGLPYIRKTNTALLASEGAYCTITNMCIQQALAKRLSNKSPATFGLLDVAVQNLRMLLEYYPEKVDKKHFEMLIQAVDTRDPLFAKHTQVVVSLVRLAVYKKVLAVEDAKSLLRALQLGEDALTDEQVGKIREITAEIQRCTESISGNESDTVLTLIKKLNLWQECFCIYSSTEFTNALSALCGLLQKPVEGIVTAKVLQALNRLLFASGQMLGHDRQPPEKAFMLPITRMLLDSLLNAYTYHFKKHPDTSPIRFERKNDIVQALIIPESRRQSLFYLESILILLKKAHDSNVFAGHEDLFSKYCEKVVTHLEHDHKDRAAYAADLIQLPLQVFAKLLSCQQYVSQSLVFVDRFFGFLKTDTTQCRSMNLYKCMNELLDTRCIEQVQTQDDAKLVLGWLTSFNSLNSDMLFSIAKQVNTVSFFKPGQPNTLYNKLPTYLKPLIV